MLNTKMMQTESSDVCSWRLRELAQGTPKENLGGICQKDYGEL